MPKIGATELIIILVIVLIIFGVGKLPQIGGAIGKSIKEFKKSSKGEEEEKLDEKAMTKSTQAEPKADATTQSSKAEPKKKAKS